MQVAVDDEDQVVQFFPGGKPDGAQRFRLIHFAVSHEGPDLAVAGRDQFPVFQVPHEARLVNGHQRPQAHGDGRELPEIGHQPGMRVGGEAVAVNLLAELAYLVFAQTAVQESAGIDTRGRVALDEYQVAALLFRCGAKKMVESHVIQCCGRSKTGDVTAQFGAEPVGPDHHGQRVPAYQ